jgi:hypothetical protein
MQIIADEQYQAMVQASAAACSSATIKSWL